MANRTVAVELIAKVSGYTGGIKTAIGSTKDLGGELDGMRKKSKSNFDELAKGAAIGGAALAGLVGWAVKVGMEFDKQMSEVRAITNASADDMGKLRQAALDAGQATIFSATDAAKAESELAKAGLTTADILGGALDGALSLAAAGSLDLAEAAEIAAKTMGQFQLSGKDVGHVADLLAGSANASATDVHDLGEALKMGGLAASAAGMDVEQTTTILTAFANKALTGSDAGTSLKTMLMMLQSPTVKAAGAMEQYGFNVYDANGNMVDAYEIAQRLQDSFGNLTQQKRNEAFATIFGSDATRAANVLYKEGAAGLHNVNKELLAQADASRVAQQKTDNLSGDVERLTGSLESLMITAQSGTTGPLRFIVQALDHMVSSFAALSPGVQQSIFILAGLTGGALLAAVAFIKMKNSIGDALESLREAGPVSAKAANGLEAVSKFAGRAALTLTALQIAGAVVSKTMSRDVNPQVDALADSLGAFGESGKAGGEAARLFGDNLQDLDYDLSTMSTHGFQSFETSFAGLMEMIGGEGPGSQSIGKAKERLQTYDAALTQLTESGHADEAAAAFKRMWVEAQKQHISLDDLQRGFPQYIAAAEKAAKANNAQALAAQETAKQNVKLAGAFGEAANEADGLVDAFNSLNGVELNWRDAERNAEAAIDDLTDALKESNGSLNVHDEKGRAAAAAVDKVAESAAKAAQAKYNETGSVEQANAVYQTYIDALKVTLKQADLTKAQIDDLVSSVAAMPSTKTITITADVKVNQSQLNKVYDQLSRAGAGRANGGVLTYASGGTYENHQAQIAPAGAMRLWSEPETGGEAYIPLAAAKRDRSVATLADVDRRFGYPLSGGGGGVAQVVVSLAPGADSQLLSGVMQYLRFTVDTQFAGNANAALSRRRR